MTEIFKKLLAQRGLDENFLYPKYDDLFDSFLMLDMKKAVERIEVAKENDEAALDELKPQLTTLNHIKYNFDVLERDYLPEEKDLHREEHQER